MKTICYDKTGEAIADFQSEDLAKEFLTGTKTLIMVSTENFIMAARCLVAEGFYPYDKVVFEFDGMPIALTKSGNCVSWPPGFLDTTLNFSMRTLKARPKKNEKK